MDAHTAASFVLWRTGAVGDFSPDQWRQFDEATKEIRYTVMETGHFHGAAVEEEFESEIDGMTFRQVLKTGFQSELQRKREERDALKEFLTANSHLLTYEGDAASANYLAAKRRDQMTRLRATADQIAAIRGHLAAIGFAETTAEPVLPPAPSLSGTAARIAKGSVAEQGDVDALPVRIPAGQ